MEFLVEALKDEDRKKLNDLSASLEKKGGH